MKCQNKENVLLLLLLVEVFMGEAAFDQSSWMPEILVHGVIKKMETMDVIERRNIMSKRKGIRVHCEFRRWQID